MAKTIKELIEEARTTYLSQAPTFDSLANIDAELKKSISLEQKQALRSIRGEVIGVLYNQILMQWLIANSIPESLWINYTYDGTEVRYNG